MSKKCCGIIYKDEKFCTMCGKALKDVPDEQDILNMEEVEKIAAEVLGDNVAEDSGATDEIKEQKKETPQEKVEEAVQEAAQEIAEEAVQEVSQDILQDANGIVEEINGEKAEEPEELADQQPQDEKEVGENADNQEEDEDEEDYDDGTASGGLKFFGTLMILLMIGSIAAVGLGVYFIMLKPFYREHDINNPIVYQQMATDTDVTNIETRPALVEVSIDSLTEDASQEEIATDSDATATDADASQDIE